MKLVKLHWLDSHSPDMNGWLNPEEIPHNVLPIKTVGFILKETKLSITIASQVTEGCEQVAGVISIPKCAVIKRKYL